MQCVRWSLKIVIVERGWVFSIFPFQRKMGGKKVFLANK